LPSGCAATSVAQWKVEIVVTEFTPAFDKTGHFCRLAYFRRAVIGHPPSPLGLYQPRLVKPPTAHLCFGFRRHLYYYLRENYAVNAPRERVGLGRAKGGAPMIDFKIVAILVGVAITFTLQNRLDARWYVSIASGIVGYILVRFIGWAINERIRRNRTKQRDPLVK
jgi:hypothetical protein